MKFLTDENLDDRIITALKSRLDAGTVIRVHDVGLLRAKDPIVLEWAATHSCILLTHDVKTMPRFAYDRVASSLPMPGIFEVGPRAPVRRIIEDLVLVALCSHPDEWADKVTFIPF